MPSHELVTINGFDPYVVKDTFEAQGCPVELVKASNVLLVPTDPGSAVECSDGRKLARRKKHGPKQFGAFLSIAAGRTGGNMNGLVEAFMILRDLGYTPGLHGDEEGEDQCGFRLLWMDGRLTTVAHQWSMSQDLLLRSKIRTEHLLKTAAGAELGLQITEPEVEWKEVVEAAGGRCMTVLSKHREEAIRINPFFGMTEDNQQYDRFHIDDWLADAAGIPLLTRCAVADETVRKLKPDAARVEMLIR